MLRLRIVNLVVWVISIAFVRIAAAQESSTPPPWPNREESPFPSVPPEHSTAPSPTVAQIPSPSPTRSVRVSFVPPPMEGTISLGIYDQSGKLVRVLHQNAQLDDFTIGADALVTRWDGKDDAGQDLPAGQYHARGYLIGPLKLEDLGQTSTPKLESDANTVLKIQLVRNPLRKDKKPVVELGIGFNANGSYLKTSDGLPLFTLSETLNMSRVWIATTNQNAIDLWQDDGTKAHQFRISNVNQMMAFDCGEFTLK
jgi:hypothetical protein